MFTFLKTVPISVLLAFTFVGLSIITGMIALPAIFVPLTLFVLFAISVIRIFSYFLD